MISEYSLRRLDTYFSSDTQARTRTFLILSAIGVLIFAVSKHAGASDRVSMLVTAVILVVSFWIRLRIYISLSKIDAPYMNEVQQSATEELLYGRRFAIVRFSAFMGTIALFGFMPKSSSATAINGRIRDLLKQDRRPEAEALTNSAIRAGIPIDADLFPLAGTKVESGENMQTFLQETSLPAGTRLAKVRLNTGQVITVWVPTVGIPETREYNITASVITRGFSIVGIGSKKGSIVFWAERAIALFVVERGAPADTLFYRLHVRGVSDEITSASFVSVLPDARRVLVDDTEIENMTQSLDRIEWTDVVFNHCHILLGGGPFRLGNVTFNNCEFDFADHIPDETRNTFHEKQKLTLTMQYL